MSIRISGPSVLATPSNTLLFNASQAVISCRIKVDATSGTLPGNAILFGRSSSQGFVIQATTANALPAIKVTLIAQTGATNFTYTFNYTPGRSYHLVAVWDAVNIIQTIYLNGTAVKTGNIASLLQNGLSSSYLQIGSTSLAANSIIQVDDCHLWAGTALTDADVLALRDRTVDPTALYPANRVWGVTLDGTDGAAVAAGNAGLTDTVGTRHLTPSGTGTLTWSNDALPYIPAIATTARVLTSGKTIAFFFNDSTTNVPVHNTSLASHPTVAINGGVSIALSNPIVSLSDQTIPYALYALPTPVSSSDTVTYTAAEGWARVLSVANTSYPPAFSGFATNLAVTNGTGLDNVPFAAPTMKLGLNVADENYFTPGRLSRNIVRTSGQWLFSPTFDANGKPTGFSGSSVRLTIPYTTFANGIDSLGHVTPASIPWMPENQNRYTVVWDEASPSNNSNFRLLTGSDNLSDSRAVITERTDLAVDPADGRRRTRVYEVAHADNATDYTLRLRLYCDRVDWSNLYIFGPGNTVDFVDMVDEVSKAYIAGAPVVRFMGATEANSSPVATRAMLRPLSDFSNDFNVPLYATLTQAGPVNTLSDYFYGAGWLAVSFTTAAPHGFYTGQAVSFKTSANTTFSATTTLAADISASSASVTVASIGSIRVSDYLVIDSEWVRVTAISGTTCTVARGENSTTAAPHTAGATITHYPQAVFASDGVTRSNLFANVSPIVVTSPTTFEALMWHGNTSLGTNTANALPGQTFAAMSVAGINSIRPGMPFEQVFRSASTLGVQPWINVPFAADDDCVLAIAEMARDYLTPGLKVWVEFSNEIWNGALGFQGQQLGALIQANKAGLGSANGPRWGALRAKQVFAIFENVFVAAGRADDLVRVLGWFWAGASATRGLLDFCVANSVPIDAVAIAPYRKFPSGWGSAADSYDTEQLHDALQLMLTHSAPQDTSLPGGRYFLHKSALAATYPNARLVCYEGSIEGLLASNMTNYAARVHDVFYHPQMYNTYRAFLNAMQTGGVSLFCHFLLTNPASWGAHDGGWMLYAWHGQPWGRGDGSDGKANNLNCLAVAKPANVNQDLQNVSVMGQAFKDWIAALPDQTAVITPMVVPGALGSSTAVWDTAAPSSGLVGLTALPGTSSFVETIPAIVPLSSTGTLLTPQMNGSAVCETPTAGSLGTVQPTNVLVKLYANPNTLEYQATSEPVKSIAGRSITSGFDFFAASEPFTTASQVVSVSLETTPPPIEATAAAAIAAIIGDASLLVNAPLASVGSVGLATSTVASAPITVSLSTTSTLGSPLLATAHAMNANDLRYFKISEPTTGLAGRFSTTGLDSFSRSEPFAAVYVVANTSTNVSTNHSALAAPATLATAPATGNVVASATGIGLAGIIQAVTVSTGSTLAALAYAGSGILSNVALNGGVLVIASTTTASAALPSATAAGVAGTSATALTSAGAASPVLVLANAALPIEPIASPGTLGASHYMHGIVQDVLAMAGAGTLPLARRLPSQTAKRYVPPRRLRAR